MNNKEKYETYAKMQLESIPKKDYGWFAKRFALISLHGFTIEQADLVADLIDTL